MALCDKLTTDVTSYRRVETAEMTCIFVHASRTLATFCDTRTFPLFSGNDEKCCTHLSYDLLGTNHGPRITNGKLDGLHEVLVNMILLKESHNALIDVHNHDFNSVCTHQ